MEILTLEALRKASGKSMGAILASLKEDFPEIAPVQRSGIINWEKQGITDVRVIRALSSIYAKEFETVEAAALYSRGIYLSKKVTKIDNNGLTICY